MAKIKLAVLFGSRSAEHDVSIVSGLQLLENVNKQAYDAYPVYVSRTGEWFVGEPLRDVAFYRTFDPNAKGITRVYLPPVPKCGGLYSLQSGGLFQKAGTKVADMDCAILAFHGMHGEDGCMQGLFELCDIPYSSVGVTGSGVGMDKIVMKAVFQSMGLPVLPAKYCYRSEWQTEPERVLGEMESVGAYPLFVKPANLGSSIGITRATDRESLRKAIDVASYYDRRILVEKGVNQPREVNCAGLGYGADCLPSVCEQPVSKEELLSFDDKYMTSGKGKGMQSLSRQIPAPIGEELTRRIQDMTRDIFKMLECKGVVRIDYMIDESIGQVYVNEINTIPGSFAFYLFEPMGISYAQLIDKLVEYAYAALKEKQGSVFAFESELLKKVSLGGGAKGAKGGKL
ncbi:MAG: D-alanine--D-alanine ligase family protein [Bacillota bacterium]